MRKNIFDMLTGKYEHSNYWELTGHIFKRKICLSNCHIIHCYEDNILNEKLLIRKVLRKIANVILINWNKHRKPGNAAVCVAHKCWVNTVTNITSFCNSCLIHWDILWICTDEDYVCCLPTTNIWHLKFRLCWLALIRYMNYTGCLFSDWSP